MTKLRALLPFVAFFAMCLAPREAKAVNDPHRGWYAIETPHFRITYHSGIEPIAQHIASLAEQIQTDMVAHVGWDPREKTEIVLTDDSEVANGSAGALPYNALHLLVTAPEDMSPLGDVDDWSYELVTHEYTHILHTDLITGIPALVNAIVGKTLAPNQTQPRWILEGLAVYHESARTSGGRLRNSMWDMFMRADVLEDNIASIDQISHIVRRWPQGNLYYQYGSFFTKWVSDTYGEESLRKAAADYGKQLIPWGFNRSIRRATGETYVEMYPKWIASMKQDYAQQAEEVRKKGIREGTRITTTDRSLDIRVGFRRTRGRSTRASSSTTATTRTTARACMPSISPAGRATSSRAPAPNRSRASSPTAACSSTRCRTVGTPTSTATSNASPPARRARTATKTANGRA